MNRDDHLRLLCVVTTAGGWVGAGGRSVESSSGIYGATSKAILPVKSLALLELSDDANLTFT